MRRVMIAGTHSGCGKTTVTLGIMAALKKKGLIVQPFKTGPDFIDTGLHRLVTGRTSRNLDLWMCGPEYVRRCVEAHCLDADIAVVEGVMGLYDGDRSTAALSSIIGAPVILVVDAYGMAETAGAIVSGMRNFRPPFSPILGKEETEEFRIEFAGVIFNRVASESHFARLKKSVADIPVLGYLPRELDFEIPHRHLGLVTAEDGPLSEENIDRLADSVLKYIDVDSICKEASPSPQSSPPSGEDVLSVFSPLRTEDELSVSPPLRGGDEGEGVASGITSITSNKSKLVRLAVARDRAFCFYYEDNLDLLRDAGAEVIFFSPLSDTSLPEGIDGIYIGGGYPELNAEGLAGNLPMRESIREWADSGRPIYAECGGLMYLSRGICDTKSKRHEMSGVFPFETEMKPRLARLGYREIRLEEPCLLGVPGAIIKGHEFHYSDISAAGPSYRHVCYSVRNSSGANLQAEGYLYKNVLGSYIHLHFGSNSDVAGNMINFIKNGGIPVNG